MPDRHDGAPDPTAAPARASAPAEFPPARTPLDWDVFIAHPSPDKARAVELFTDLTRRRVRAFFDRDCVPLGVSWDAAISGAQRRSAVVAVLVSAAAEDAYYLREEVRAAIQRARKDGEWTRVVPVLLPGCPADDDAMPYGLGLKQGLTLGADGMAAVADRLVSTVEEVARLRWLAGLLSDAFGATADLDAWLGGLRPGDARHRAPALPDRGVTIEEAARDAVTRIVSARVAPNEVFDSLAARTPSGDSRWVERVEALRRAWSTTSPVVPPPMASPDLRALLGWRAFEQAMLARADRLPSCLGAPEQGQHLVDLYVELDLEALGPAHGLEGLERQLRLEAVLDIATRRCWSISGEPGSGKSTLLQVTTRRLLDGRARVPIQLTISELCLSGGLVAAVQAVVESEVGRAHAALAADIARMALASGTAVILLDGLDEEPDADAARKAIRGAVVEAGRCPIVVAGRPIAYETEGLGSSFHPLRLLGLDEPRAEELLRKRLGGRAHAVVDQLRRARQQAVLRSPLLLALLARFVEESAAGTALPEDRIDLYERLVPLLVDPRQLPAGRGRSEGRFPDAAAARRDLEEVALAVHVSPGSRVPVARVVAALRACGSADPEGFLGRVAVVTGLVSVLELADRGRVVVFPHRTVREFLSAGALVRDLRRDGLEGARVRKVLEMAGADPSTWAELLALTAGLLSRPNASDDERPWWLDAAADAGTDGVLDALIRDAAARSRPLAFRVVVDARGLAAQTILEVLQVDPGREAWQKRMEVFGRLVELAGDAATAVALVPRILAATGTTHGADLFWARELLRRVDAGEVPLPEDAEAKRVVRAQARATMDRLFDHVEGAERRRQEAVAALEPLWRTVPPDLPHRFRMGSPEDEEGRWDDEGPAHEVVVTGRLAVMVVPVTNALYRLFDRMHPRADEHPVVGVTWYEAVAFADWLGIGARLPTETEWEMACRAGTTTRYSSGDLEADLARVGWYAANSGGTTHPVGEKPANAWGLHDVHGNVWEWCQDEWRDDYRHFEDGRVHDPAAALPRGDPLARRVIRGGSWWFVPLDARSACRCGRHPDGRNDNRGFRLVLPSLPPGR